MSTPWAQTTVLSTGVTAGGSTPIALDPLSKMTAIQITAPSTAGFTGSVFIQGTLDTPSFASGGAGGAIPSSPSWSAVSSTPLSSASQLGDGTFPMLTLLQPVAGLRLFASSGAGSAALTLHALQSPSA
jgi:hypothetical protein